VKRLFYLTVCILPVLSCHKEWEPPVICTVNASLYYSPDSTDEQLVHYYADGMRLRVIVTIVRNGQTVAERSWKHQENYHWEDDGESFSVSAEVISLNPDTAFSVSDYPVILRVYRDTRVLFDEQGAQLYGEF